MNIGTTTIDKITVGTTEIDKIYQGTSLVYSKDDLTQVSTWEPSKVPNMYCWLDSVDNDTLFRNNSNKVVMWSDKSSNSFSFLQTTASRQPTSNITGVAFDGGDVLESDDVAFAAASNSGANHSIFIVSRSDSTGPRTILASQDSNKLNIGSGTSSSDNNAVVNYGDGSNWNSTAAVSPATSMSFKNMLSIVNKGSSTNVYVNGASKNDINGTMDSFTGLRVGASNSTGTQNPWSGELMEIVIFNVRLHDTQREMIEGYLAHKWGLNSSLPSSHAYKLAPPY